MRGFGFGLGIALILAARVAVASPSPPLEAYGRLPDVDLIDVSPDGSRIALVVGSADAREIQVVDAADLSVYRRASLGDIKVRALAWAGGNHVLVAASKTSRGGLFRGMVEALFVTDFNLDRNKAVALLDGNLPGVARMLNTARGLPVVRIIDGRPVAFITGTSFPGRQGVATLIRVDLDANRMREVVEGSPDTQRWLLDAAGGVAARVDYANATGDWTLWTGHDGHLVKSLHATDPIDSPRLLGLGRDPDTVLVAVPGPEGETTSAIRRGSDHAVPAPEFDGVTPLYPRSGGASIGAVHDTGLAPHVDYFAPTDAALWAQIGRSFPREVVRVESWSDDHRTVILRVEGKASGAAYYRLDATTRRAAWLADEHGGVGVGAVVDKIALSYRAGDGTMVPAYLTLPPGRKPVGLPLVVLVHGGPEARDEPGFDWWSQALASRGYAVLQPQYRGSTGFGRAHHAAGFGEWGRKMQTDLSDGVAYLADAGTIDRGRVCIVGASYGGYAALAGVTLQHGIYQCAVSLAGPSDLRTMLASESRPGGGSNHALRYWQRFMGAASRSDPALDAISPAKHAADATVPVLLLHGRDDTVVPFAQSSAMAAALTRAGHPTEVVALPGEDHWLSRSETRTAMLRATVDFLADHLAPGVN